MTFHLPVYVGDVLSVYAELVRRGRTSLSLHLEAWAERGRNGEDVRVTEGEFVFVAIDQEGRPRALPSKLSLE